MLEPAQRLPPWRIALCITELNVGGAERALVELATGLDRARFTPSVYCLSPRPASGKATLVQRLEAAGVPVHFLNARGPWDTLRVLRQLRRLWRADPPHLVQTWLWHANVLGVRAARQAGVAYIVTGLRVAEPRRRWRLWMERIAGRSAERHVAVSEAVVDFARRRIGLDPQKIVVISNGVALPATTEHQPRNLAAFGMTRGRRAIVFVGRLDMQKGVDQLLQNAPRLLSRLPDHDLLLFGEGPLDAALGNVIAALNPSGRVHLCGWTDDVNTTLALADVVVVPSRWEGMPNVVLEAMAAGRAVVAFDVEGVGEALGDGACEQAVAPQDWDAFIERTMQLATDEPLRRQLELANRRRAAEFSWSRMVGAYAALYEALIVRSRF